MTLPERVRALLGQLTEDCGPGPWHGKESGDRAAYSWWLENAAGDSSFPEPDDVATLFNALLSLASIPSQEPRGLDEAWKAAEAALREELTFSLTRAIRPVDEGVDPTYYATATRPWSGGAVFQVSGPTPTAALLALAERLRP